MAEIPKDLNSLNQESMKEFLNSFDTVFTDCDGVLWLANDPIENSSHVLNRLRKLGKKLIFVTNNSTKTRDDIVVKMKNLGIIGNEEEIINPSYLVADYLKRLNFKKKAYVIGYPAITKELDRFGIRHAELGPDIMDTDLLTYIKTRMKLDPDVGAVVLGTDEHYSYPKMMKAINYLNDRNCLFIATEYDETFAVDGIIFPLAGCLVTSLETGTKRNAYFVGKPSDHIVEFVKRNYATDPSRTLMVGDNCATDIVFGKKCGFKTLLVLSGVTSREEMLQLTHSGEDNHVPDYFINKLGDLLRHL